MEIILASTSKNRHKLLTQAGVQFEVCAPNVDESVLKKEFCDLSVDKLAIKLAECKALSIDSGDAWVIGSDQICALGDQMYDKPESLPDAQSQLMQLQGKVHQQFTAVVVAYCGQIVWSYVDVSHLAMRKLSSTDIEHYIEMDKPIGCAGSYQLESRGMHLFQRIDGDRDAILGLPVVPLLDVLYQRGVLNFDNIVLG